MTRTPRDLRQLREHRARYCRAMVDGRRCSLRWAVAKRLDVDSDEETLLCTRHARAARVTVWTDDQERREVKQLRRMQLTYERMAR